MDPCDCGGAERLGLIDLQGRPKATYNGFRLWTMMPVDRSPVQKDVAGLEAMASSDDHSAGLLLLNRTGALQLLDVAFRNVPFKRGRVMVYPVDAALIARLGMAGQRTADQEIGVTAENLPSSRVFKVKVEGALTKVDANSLLGLRIDYQGAGGAYSSGTLFHGPYRSGGVDLHDPLRNAPMPYGTLRAPDKTVAVADFSDFEVKVAKHAPPGWTGRAQLLFILQNAGPDVRAVIQVRPKTPAVSLLPGPRRAASLPFPGAAGAGPLHELRVTGSRLLLLPPSPVKSVTGKTVPIIPGRNREGAPDLSGIAGTFILSLGPWM